MLHPQQPPLNLSAALEAKRLGGDKVGSCLDGHRGPKGHINGTWYMHGICMVHNKQNVL